MRGHEVYYNIQSATWHYCDTKEIADDSRVCKRCGRKPTPKGYDACLGHIGGATSVCCGHGVEDEIRVME